MANRIDGEQRSSCLLSARRNSYSNAGRDDVNRFADQRMLRLSGRWVQRLQLSQPAPDWVTRAVCGIARERSFSGPSADDVQKNRRQLQSSDPLSVGDELIQVEEVDAWVNVTAVESSDDFGAYTVVTTGTATPEYRSGVPRWELQRCDSRPPNLFLFAWLTTPSDTTGGTGLRCPTLPQLKKEQVALEMGQEEEEAEATILAAQEDLAVAASQVAQRALAEATARGLPTTLMMTLMAG